MIADLSATEKKKVEQKKDVIKKTELKNDKEKKDSVTKTDQKKKN